MLSKCRITSLDKKTFCVGIATFQREKRKNELKMHITIFTRHTKLKKLFAKRTQAVSRWFLSNLIHDRLDFYLPFKMRGLRIEWNLLRGLAKPK